MLWAVMVTFSATAYLFKEAVLLIGNGGGSLRELAPFLPQSSPHVFFLKQRVQFSERVQNLLEHKKDQGKFFSFSQKKTNNNNNNKKL